MVALFVLGTIVLFLLADLVVIFVRRRQMAGMPAMAAPAVSITAHEVPGGVFVHPSHLWITIDPRGRVKIGLDELAQKLLGPLEAVRFPAAGRRVVRGETLFSVHVGDVEIPIPSPITGVLESTQVPADGSVLATDPESWICAIKPERLAEEIRPLRIAEDAARWMGAEFGRLREMVQSLRLSPAAVGLLPDGGELADGLLRVLPASERDIVIREFIIKEA